jgi:hypothetical protein
MKNNIKIKQIKFSNENNIIVILSNDKNIHIPKNYTERLSKSDINDIKKYRILPDGY